MYYRKPVFLTVILALAAGSIFSGSYPVKAATSPYPPSSVITGLTWDTTKWFWSADGSDLWPNTWASDGNIYSSWGDGGGFGGTNTDGRVSTGIAKITGGPIDANGNPSYIGTNVNGGKNALNPASFDCTNHADCGKFAALISVNGTLYGWLNTQNSNPPDYKLVWSNNLGATWSSSSWVFPGSGTFFPGAFLNFGQNNAGARDGYVYTYGAKWTETQGIATDLYLMRMPTATITDRTTYQFFTGKDASGNPIWSSDVNQRSAVFSDPNSLGNAGIGGAVYNPVLRRYVLAQSHGGVGGRVGFFDAPEPWGPWTTMGYYDNWIGAENNKATSTGEALVYEFANKWTSGDGKTMWLIFSCYGCNANYHDRFNLIKATLTTGGTNTPTPTSTPRPTNTPIPSPSGTPAPTSTPVPTNTSGPTNSPTAIPNAGIINNLLVADSANAVDWSARSNLQVGNQEYGDRTYTWAGLAAFLPGSDWVRSANDSKNYTGASLATFKVSTDAYVYILSDDRIAIKPDWMTTYAKSAGTASDNGGLNFSIFYKWFPANSTVQIGPNGGDPLNSSMYTTVVKTAKTGDADADDMVGGSDFVIWLNHYNTLVNLNAMEGDFDNDGKVDGLDYTRWLNNYGK